MPAPGLGEMQKVRVAEEWVMGGLVKHSFDDANEVRTPAKSRVEVVDLGSTKAARLTLEPGWRWSECIKPVVGTERCQVRHVGAVVSGRLALEHDDGSTIEIGPGDAYVIEPGHEAWVVGDDTFVGLEFEPSAAESYATTPS
jgi:hypothetical protein